MSARPFPQRPASHDIADAAVRLFCSQCPSSWNINALKSEYGVDLVIELKRGTDATGEEFLVQVKGHRSIRPRPSNVVVERIRPATVNYWLNKLQPVLLVAVDVSQRSYWFDWLQDAYPTYPKGCSGSQPVALSLSKHSGVCDIAKDIPAFVMTFYDRLRLDISTLFDRTQLTRILLHVSELYRHCVDMVLALQRGDCESAEQMQALVSGFILAFGIHDDFLMTLWKEYLENEPALSETTRRMIGEKLKDYADARKAFYFRENAVPAGDVVLVPVKFSRLHEDVPHIMAVLSELQQVLLRLLVLGRYTSESLHSQ